MTRDRRLARILIAACALLLAPRNAWAYIDPGSGGMVLQVIVGAVVGVGVALKMSWRRILGWFGRRDRDPDA